MTTLIEWADDVWNPTVGCSPAGEGCRNCYAARQAARGMTAAHRGLTKRVDGRAVFNGTVRELEERLALPLHWKKPRRIFVDSMSDLFHPEVPDAFRDRVYAVMALCPQHQFIVLTKRAEGMAEYLGKWPVTRIERVAEAVETIDDARKGMSSFKHGWPLPNVVLGVSVSNQAEADELVPWLLRTPSAFRIVSYEPALGPVDFTRLQIVAQKAGSERAGIHVNALTGKYWESGMLYEDEDGAPVQPLDGIVCGGESGPGARPMHPDWARAVRDQCVAAGVKFFFKQWGEWAPTDQYTLDGGTGIDQSRESERYHQFSDGTVRGVLRVGKARAGRLLDGREWNEWVKS